MFASVRNAFQRNLAMSNDDTGSLDVGKKQKFEPILDKEFIVSSRGYDHHYVLFDFAR